MAACWIFQRAVPVAVRRITSLALILIIIFSFCWTADDVNLLHGRHTHERLTRQVAGNLDAALRNPSFVRFQLACLLDRSPCDRIGLRIKGLLPEMVATGQCSQCSPQEIGQAGKVMSFIEEHYPVEYDQLERKFLSDTKLQDVFD